MKDLSRLFEVPFDDPHLGLGHLLAFATDHLQRMIANNPASALDARIAATQDALAQVNTFFSEDNTSLGLRKGQKMAKRKFRAGLRAKIAKLAGAVMARYGLRTALYLECFPHGRRNFNRCTDDQLGTHLVVLRDRIAAHGTDLGATAVAEAAALVEGWASIHAASERATGAKTATQEAKKLAREHLQLMLYLNVVKLMELFPRQPERCGLYLQQSLLHPRPRRPTSDAPAAATVPETMPLSPQNSG